MIPWALCFRYVRASLVVRVAPARRQSRRFRDVPVSPWGPWLPCFREFRDFREDRARPEAPGGREGPFPEGRILFMKRLWFEIRYYAKLNPSLRLTLKQIN